MSLDCDQKRTKQLQNLWQPQLWGEDGDGFTNSSWDGFQSQQSQASSVLPGWDVNNIPSFILYAHIHPGLIFIPGKIPGIV